MNPSSAPTKSNEFKLGKVAGLELSATPSALIASLILWVILAAVAYLLPYPYHTTLLGAIIGGFAAVILHHLSDLWHQLGHSWAARNVGHPMIGIRFGFLGLLSADIYPADEGELPAGVHIRRALGGPLASLAMSVVAGIIFLVLNGRGYGALWLLSLFFFLENFVVFTLEIFLPLGFNDASTVLHWLRQPAKK